MPLPTDRRRMPIIKIEITPSERRRKAGSFPQWILDQPLPRGFDRWADHDDVRFWRDPNRRDPEGHRLLRKMLDRGMPRQLT